MASIVIPAGAGGFRVMSGSRLAEPVRRRSELRGLALRRSPRGGSQNNSDRTMTMELPIRHHRANLGGGAFHVAAVPFHRAD